MPNDISELELSILTGRAGGVRPDQDERNAMEATLLSILVRKIKDLEARLENLEKQHAE